jgi:hypothetical protein
MSSGVVAKKIIAKMQDPETNGLSDQMWKAKEETEKVPL